jgi:pSer/pThr/pTyr-binding forkhead associated (FHA) protein
LIFNPREKINSLNVTFTLETFQHSRLLTTMPRITITVHEQNAQAYRFPLDSQVVKLGRSAENDVVIDSGSVSSFHAEMRRTYGGYELHDLGSTNGITLDEDSYSVIPLRSGMSAKIGDVAFDFLLSDEEISALSQERAPESATTPTLDSLPPVSTGPSASTRPSASANRPVPKPAIYTQAASSSGGGTMLVFLISAAMAFCAGLAVRYQKETGGSLPAAVKAKFLAPPAVR